MNFNILRAYSFVGLLVVCLLAGCSGENFGSVPVKGTITMDGKPIAGIEVSFFPLPTESSSIVGPFSTGVSDENGNFELQTRYGEPGAVIGRHRVSFQHNGIDPETMAAAQSAMAEAKADGGDADVAKAAMSDAKSALKGKVKIPNRYTEEGSEIEYTVPAGGVDNLEFKLESK